MTVIASASGTRVDCDICGEHTASHDLTLEQLHRATGYVRVDGRDYCPRCAVGGSQRHPVLRGAGPGSRVRSD
jgi:hypothetical protein